jgi:peroxiredoxin
MRGFANRISSMENAIADLKLTRAISRGDQKAAKEQLALAKDIPSVRLTRIQLALGDAAKAEELARDLIKADPGQTLPYALLAHVLAQANRMDDAMKTFQQLREHSGNLDLDLPPFARMAPLAQKLNLPADWRIPHQPAADAGERPPLAQLGPFRWHPYSATPFTLTDSKGATVSFDDYRGKPVLLVFYLGAGCSRCIAQLNSFAPLAKAYADAGIQIIAVSTDTPEGLNKTFEQAKDAAGFPFKIVSDHAMDNFRAYRAYDDFEKMPLHGTFLIDGAGFVRWQNISYAPFTEPKWLLDEAKRLLAIPVEPTAATVKRGN